MSDDLDNRGVVDRAKINLSESWEVAYWTKKFGCSAARLRAAVKRVGNGADAVGIEMKREG